MRAATRYAKACVVDAFKPSFPASPSERDAIHAAEREMAKSKAALRFAIEIEVWEG